MDIDKDQWSKAPRLGGGLDMMSSVPQDSFGDLCSSISSSMTHTEGSRTPSASLQMTRGSGVQVAQKKDKMPCRGI